MKKYFIMLLSLLMLFTFAACEDDEKKAAAAGTQAYNYFFDYTSGNDKFSTLLADPANDSLSDSSNKYYFSRFNQPSNPKSTYAGIKKHSGTKTGYDDAEDLMDRFDRTYDANGILTSYTYKKWDTATKDWVIDGSTATYTVSGSTVTLGSETAVYDSEWRISSRTIGAKNFTYTYDASTGNISTVTLKEGVDETVYTYSFNSTGTEPEGLLIVKNKDTITKTAYNYKSEDGKIKYLEQVVGASVLYTITYTYNSDGQVEKATDGTDTETYEWDENGFLAVANRDTKIELVYSEGRLVTLKSFAGDYQWDYTFEK